MDLSSHLSAGTREGKHWGKKDCFHDDMIGKNDGGWLRQKDGCALKDGHWGMGTGGWVFDGVALEGGPNGQRVSPEI